jgi:homoserine dehydrogenase
MSTKKINIILFGIETIGSSLINQVLTNQKSLFENKNLELRLPIITNSTVAFFEKPTVKNFWEANFVQFSVPFKVEDIINFVQENELENLIAIDTTETEDLLPEYFDLLQNDFDIISINPTIETLPADFNASINANLKKFGKDFFFINPTKKETISESIFKKIIQIAEKPELKIAI